MGTSALAIAVDERSLLIRRMPGDGHRPGARNDVRAFAGYMHICHGAVTDPSFPAVIKPVRAFLEDRSGDSPRWL